MLIKECLPVVISTLVHARYLRHLESVHCDTSYEGDMDAQAAMCTGAAQADENTELGGGLASAVESAIRAQTE